MCMAMHGYATLVDFPYAGHEDEGTSELWCKSALLDQSKEKFQQSNATEMMMK